jgi:hypothetical protein
MVRQRRRNRNKYQGAQCCCRKQEGYIPLDESGEVMHMAAGRHDRQHVAPTAEVEREKTGDLKGLLPKDYL